MSSHPDANQITNFIKHIHTQDFMTTCSSSSIDSSIIKINNNSPSDNEINIMNSGIDKYRIIRQNSCEISDDLLEIQQIEYEQRLIHEEINRIDAEKQRLEDLLSLIQSTKPTNKRKFTKDHHRRRLQRRNSNSGSE